MEPDEYLLVPPDYFRELREEEIFSDAAGVSAGARPVEIDLGAGNGSFAVALAAHDPARNVLAVERLLGRARKICRHAARAGVANLKVLRMESAYTVEWLLPAAGASRVHLLFPDPWPKRRHERRRLAMRPDFLRGVARVLGPGGELLLKMDESWYFEAAMGAIGGSGLFRERGWDDEAVGYCPETDFESQWKGEGKEIFRARWVKK